MAKVTWSLKSSFWSATAIHGVSSVTYSQRKAHSSIGLGYKDSARHMVIELHALAYSYASSKGWFMNSLQPEPVKATFILVVVWNMDSKRVCSVMRYHMFSPLHLYSVYTFEMRGPLILPWEL